MNTQFALVMLLAGALGTGSAVAQPVPPQAIPPPAPVVPVPVIPVLPSVELALETARDALAAIDAEGITAAMAQAHEAMLVAGAHRPGFELSGQEREQAAAAREKARLAAQRDHEEGRYDAAMRHIYESRWERAVEAFDAVLRQKSGRADAALYWKAYAQDRLGQRAEALTTLGTLTRDHQSSRYLQQARALEAEVRRNAGQPVNPQDQADEDLKLMAIVALQNSAPEQAVPMLQKLLDGTASPKLKERALFVLAQSDSPQARDVLEAIARGSSTPELQSRAITYLGMHGGPESRAVLAEIYSATADVDSKKRIIRALAMGGEKERVLAAAQSEQNPELRAEAVRMLGLHGGHAELSQIYAKETSADIKKQIISAMAMGGNVTRLTELARGEKDPELRRAAIRSMGMMDGKATTDTLVEIYNTDRDPAVKRAVIAALGMQNSDTALVAIARKESDPNLKKEIVGRLSHMNTKAATDYMLEILNGK